MAGLMFVALTTLVHAQDTSNEMLQANQAKPMTEMELLPDLKISNKTNPEVVIFAQYKLAKAIPNIDEFAKSSPRVKKAQDIDKSAVTISEYNRMSNRYNLLNPKTPITVHTQLELDEYSSLQDLIVFDELNDKTYFNYPVYGENIAIVPKKIQRFNRINISKSNAEEMFKKLNGRQFVRAEFILLPEYADRKTPFTKDAIDHWLMLAQIAELRLWTPDDKNPKLLWFYRNPSYNPKDNKALGNLYAKDGLAQ